MVHEGEHALTLPCTDAQVTAALSTPPPQAPAYAAYSQPQQGYGKYN